MRLSTCDPYGLEWTQLYGPAIQETTLDETSSHQAFLKDSFSCLTASEVYADLGMILFIKNNFIRVRTDSNKFIYLNIGPCTRI